MRRARSGEVLSALQVFGRLQMLPDCLFDPSPSSSQSLVRSAPVVETLLICRLDPPRLSFKGQCSQRRNKLRIHSVMKRPRAIHSVTTLRPSTPRTPTAQRSWTRLLHKARSFLKSLRRLVMALPPVLRSLDLLAALPNAKMDLSNLTSPSQQIGDHQALSQPSSACHLRLQVHPLKQAEVPPLLPLEVLQTAPFTVFNLTSSPRWKMNLSCVLVN
jgi:hypothetical protein